MHLQSISQAGTPSEAAVAHLSYAITREVIAIVSTTTTASTRSATSLWTLLAGTPLVRVSSTRLKGTAMVGAYVTFCNNFVESAIHCAGR